MKSAQVRPHVIVLIPNLQGGGAERVIVTLLKCFDRNKFRLSLAVVDTRYAVYRNEIPSDIDFIDLHAPRVRYALPKIIWLIWRHRPDAVLSTLGHLNLALAMLRPVLPDGVRYVARESTVVSQLPVSYRIPRWWFWAYRKFYGRLSTVICQSRYMRDDLIKNFSFPPGKAIVINNPIDVPHIQRLAAESIGTGLHRHPTREATKAIHLVAAGRMVHVKGFDLLIEALALSSDPRLELTLLGEGPLLKDLERLVHEKGLSERVHFMGFQKNPYTFLARADAFVLSSRFEGFPNVVLEALACGTPVLAMPCPGGVREILEGIDGCILADSVAAEALAKVLRGFKGNYRVPPDVIKSYAAMEIAKRYEQVLLGEAVN